MKTCSCVCVLPPTFDQTMPLASERWTPSTNPAKTLPYLALHSRMKELANIRYWRLPSQLVVSVHCVPRITKAKAAKIVMFCFLELNDVSFVRTLLEMSAISAMKNSGHFSTACCKVLQPPANFSRYCKIPALAFGLWRS